MNSLNTPLIKYQLAGLGLLLIVLSACGKASFYDHNDSVKDPWPSTDTMHFNFMVSDTIHPFNLYLNLRNTTDYPYSNIYFFMQTHFPDGQLAVDTIEIFLADLQGNWLGKGIGKNKDLQVLFRKRGRFPMSGNYHISLEQAMRRKALPGIKSVGIRIERTK